MLQIKGGKTPAIVCNPADLYQCDGEEREYAKKIKAKFGKDVDAMKKERERIQRVTKDVDEELRQWGKVRITLLNKMVDFLKEHGGYPNESKEEL
jgi:hypothetical protein